MASAASGQTSASGSGLGQARRVHQSAWVTASMQAAAGCAPDIKDDVGHDGDQQGVCRLPASALEV